jgi:two-component system CheB/CheR fusion protein
LLMLAGAALFAALQRRSAPERGVATPYQPEPHSDAARAELQRRTKSLLAAVRSLTMRTAERSASVSEFVAHFDGRLASLARMQNMMSRGGADAVDLEELVREELLSHGAWSDQRVTVDGEPVLLAQKVAEAIALALHELAANAVKYGALSTTEGKLSVLWRTERHKGEEWLRLEWAEAGVSAMDASPLEYGFGRTMIEETLPRDLGAKTSLALSPGGIRCRIELPLIDRGADTSHDQLEAESE